MAFVACVALFHMFVMHHSLISTELALGLENLRFNKEIWGLQQNFRLKETGEGLQCTLQEWSHAESEECYRTHFKLQHHKEISFGRNIPMHDAMMPLWYRKLHTGPLNQRELWWPTAKDLKQSSFGHKAMKNGKWWDINLYKLIDLWFLE